MAEIKILAKQASHYFSGRIFLIAAQFVSFPILTRIFSVNDYGILSLMMTTIFIATGIIKFGFPNTIVQFYAEYKAKKLLDNFQSTILISSAGAAVTLVGIFYLITQLFLNTILDKNIVNLLFLVSLIILFKCINDILTSFLIAEQKTKLYNIVTVINRYSSLAFGLFFVFYVIKGLRGIFFGQIVSGFIILSFLLFLVHKSLKINIKKFSSDILKSSLIFGFPLIWAEFGHLILNYVDRYFIQFYMDSKSVGIYSAGYNLSTNIAEMIIYPINYAMTPVYMNILVNKGELETKKFFMKLFRYFLLIMIPVIFGFIAVGKNLLVVLASNRYLEANAILPYIIFGQAIYACSIILNSGLFIRKKTYVVTYIMIATCLLNIILNVMLIPRFGILGAAQATLISYIFYTMVIIYYSFKEFSFRIDYPRIVLYLFASLLMFIMIKNIHFGGHLINLTAQVGIGITAYSCLILLFDKEFRCNLIDFTKSLKM